MTGGEWVVHWRIGNAQGHGSPVSFFVASLACAAMNSKHGAGTHWMEEA